MWKGPGAGYSVERRWERNGAADAVQNDADPPVSDELTDAPEASDPELVQQVVNALCYIDFKGSGLRPTGQLNLIILFGSIWR